jgi:hypothetical protein
LVFRYRRFAKVFIKMIYAPLVWKKVMLILFRFVYIYMMRKAYFAPRHQWSCYFLKNENYICKF